MTGPAGYDAFPGPAAHPSAYGYPGPVGPQGQPGYATQGGFPGPAGPQRPDGYPDGYPGPADQAGWQGYAQPGHAGPGGYPGQHGQPWPNGPQDPYGYGQSPVNGGYAYVIQEDPFAPQSGQPRFVQHEYRQPPGPAGNPQGHAADGPGARAITVGAVGAPMPPAPQAPTVPPTMTAPPAPQAQTAPQAQAAPPAPQAQTAPRAPQPPPAADRIAVPPANAYGPDDPGYGPPAPGWQHQDRPAEPAPVDQAPVEVTVIRDPFQPPPGQSEEAAATGRGADLPNDPWDALGDDGFPGQADPGPNVGQFDYEFPSFAGDLPAGSAAGAVGQLKGLYMAAAEARPESFDKHFDQLLDRQRKLISEYFKQSGGPGAAAGPAGPVTVTPRPGRGDGTLAGFGGDQWHAR
jgi:hypothetical protein